MPEFSANNSPYSLPTLLITLAQTAVPCSDSAPALELARPVALRRIGACDGSGPPVSAGEPAACKACVTILKSMARQVGEGGHCGLQRTVREDCSACCTSRDAPQ